MNTSKINEFKVGLVSIIAIVLLLLGFIFAGKLNLSTNQKILTFHFEKSANIKISDPVMVNGVERGNIISVENKSDGVQIQANIDTFDDFRSDVSARIMILELTGGKKIEIDPGISTSKFNGGIIEGVSVSDLSELVAVVSDVSVDAVNLIRRLDSISTSINNIVSDTSMTNNLKSTISKTNELVSKSLEFFDNNKSKLENTILNIQSIVNNLGKSIDKNEPKVSELIDKLNTDLDEINLLIKDAKLSFDNVNSLVDNFSGLLNDIKSNKSTVNKLLYDEAFSNQLDSAFSELSKLLGLIKEHGVNVNVRIGTRP